MDNTVPDNITLFTVVVAAVIAASCCDFLNVDISHQSLGGSHTLSTCTAAIKIIVAKYNLYLFTSYQGVFYRKEIYILTLFRPGVFKTPKCFFHSS